MNHLKQIAQKLEEYQLDAMLITSTPGERYAIGFLGEGYVLVGRQGCHYSTDARYIEAAQKLVTGTDISLTSREHNHLALAAELIQKHGYQRVGFEDGSVSVAQFSRLKETLPCTLIPAQKLLDGLRASNEVTEERSGSTNSEHLQTDTGNTLRRSERDCDQTKKESKKRTEKGCGHKTEDIIPLGNRPAVPGEERNQHTNESTHCHHAFTSEIEDTGSLIKHFANRGKKKRYRKRYAH